MAATDSPQIPDVGELLAPLLARVSSGPRPLLLAIAERMAAERYRGWLADPANRAHALSLQACAEREEEIARRIEALHSGAAVVQEAIVAANPDLADINRAIFAGRPLAQQLAIQARGERLGAATWRAFARAEKDADRHATLLACADLEEESARALEAILATEG
jgi:hypothetical protein